MRFLPLFLYASQTTGSDALGNPVTELVRIGTSEGRFSTWTAEEIALDDRSVTVHNRKILTRALKADLIRSSRVKFDDRHHTITEIKGTDEDRWRIVVVNRYGSEEP